MQHPVKLAAIAAVTLVALAAPARAEIPTLHWRVGVGVGPSEIDSDSRFFPPGQDDEPMWTTRFVVAAESPLTDWVSMGLGGAFAQRGQIAQTFRRASDPERLDDAVISEIRRDFFELVAPLTVQASLQDWRIGLLVEPTIAWQLHAGTGLSDQMPVREASLRAGLFIERWHVRIGASYLLDRENDLTDRVAIVDRGYLVTLGIVDLALGPATR